MHRRHATRALLPRLVSSRPAKRFRYPSFHFLDDSFELWRHRRDRLLGETHFSIALLANDQVERAERWVLVREVIPEVPATTLLSRQGRSRDRFGYDEQIVEIERRVPT